MQSKKDKFFEKIVKKNYNDELEKVLEKKDFEENTKSLLLSMFYKIEAAYTDYEKAKRNVETKDTYIENIISIIKNKCNKIKIINPNSKESEELGKRTFIINKKEKEIKCYPVDRKLLYSICKLSKNDKIINNKYYLINKTLSTLINIGNNIDMVEPLRDFNGYSWTTLSKEIESIEYNLIYQNLRILLGYKFLKEWVENREYIADYMSIFKERLKKEYGGEKQEEIIEIIYKLSILLELKYNKKSKEEIEKMWYETEKQFSKIKNKETFIVEVTQKKKDIHQKIRKIDTILNNKKLLNEEYNKRNEDLKYDKKIFSMRILSDIMIREREKEFEKIEEINKLLNPQNFVKLKKELEEKEKFLNLVKSKNLEEDIEKLIIKLQKIFLKCYKMKIDKAVTKNEIIDLICQFRYYYKLPYNRIIEINKQEEIKPELDKIINILIKKAKQEKVINFYTNKEELDYEIYKNIFDIRIINLEDIYIKILKEKNSINIQIFDQDIFEEKKEISNTSEINKKDIEVKLNKKIKVFN